MLLSHRLQLALQNAWLSRGWGYKALWPVSLLHANVFKLRRWAYQQGLMAKHRLPVPVIVIGNMVVGGAGKTPTVLALIEQLRTWGYHPGIVSRGYGRKTCQVLQVTSASHPHDVGDEPLLMATRLEQLSGSGTPLFVGSHRAAAAQALLNYAPHVDVILCDDGLQHWALERDINLVVFDERGAGNGALLPAGPLREPLPLHAPEHSWVLYNAPQASTHLTGFLLHPKLTALTRLEQWPQSNLASIEQSIHHFKSLNWHDGTVYAAAGIARPERFFSLLQHAHIPFTPWPLPDHFDFNHCPWPAQASAIIVTEKDAVKLKHCAWIATHASPIWVASLGLSFEEAFLEQLHQKMTQLAPLRNSTHGQPTH